MNPCQSSLVRTGSQGSQCHASTQSCSPTPLAPKRYLSIPLIYRPQVSINGFLVLVAAHRLYGVSFKTSLFCLRQMCFIRKSYF